MGGTVMITTKLYENKDGELVAVVLEDGTYSNYVSCPEIAAMEGDSFLEEARMGFPDAYLYDGENMSLEKAAEQEERESVLVAQIDEEIVLYPRRMNPEHQEFFQMELGDEVWQALLEHAAGDEGVVLEL